MQLKEAGLAECICVIGLGELTIKQNTEITDNLGKLYRGVREGHRSRVSFVQLLKCNTDCIPYS